MVDKGGKAPIVVALSGGGRTLENLIQSERDFTYRVCGVVASRECRGIQIAESYGRPTLKLDFAEKDAISSLYKWILNLRAEWIVLAGFLKPFPLLESSPLKLRVINIHPALLPKFGGKGMWGMNVHRAVANSGESYSGATVHFVTEEYDEGRIISQIKAKLSVSDSPEVIAAKVFERECLLYPRTVDGLVRGTLPLAGDEIWRCE